MLAPDSQLQDSADILKALGQLALSASQAEAYAAQGLYYLLTDTPGDEEGSARIAAEFRSFNSLYRLLSIALRCETPLIEILEAARNDANKRDAQGDLQLVAVLAGVADRLFRVASNFLGHFWTQGFKANPGLTLANACLLFSTFVQSLSAHPPVCD